MKNRIVALLLTIALLISVGVSFAQDKTIAQLAAETPELSTLVSLVEAAGLTDVLNSNDVQLTVFAPTNDAFAALPDFVVDYVTSDVELLTRVLTYHVIAGAVTSDMVSPMSVDSMEMTAVGADATGSQLTINVDAEGNVWVDNAKVVITDIIASNGVVHVIDTVLVPPVELPEIIAADVFGDINLAGSSTVFPISQAVAADFADEGYTGEITADSIGTGAGFERFCAAEGASDISNASRPIKSSEVEACAANNQRVPVGFRVGDDGLAVVINNDNDFAQNLTQDQIRLAFSTAVTWADVDPSFPAEPIVRFSPGTDSGTFDYFVEHFFAKDTAPILAASSLNLSEDDNVLQDGVSGNRYAIGYFGYAYVAENPGVVQVVGVDGVLPTAETVNGGTYPLARPLFIYTAASVITEKPQVADFVAYYLNRVPEITPEVGYFLPNPYDFNASKLVLLALKHQALGE
jgi:phosphate transport system substrate-binding protein